MEHERCIIDCPYCSSKKTLVIDRWFLSREAMDKLGMYSWEESCSECGHEDCHYE